ncbi:MAG TPA: NADH-quinone oxidoreductase subunit C [Mycobacteriales bacterium]|nr:NADH-quinone oxidoreductase subunit C [Mycobacteriales bacterium]
MTNDTSGMPRHTSSPRPAPVLGALDELRAWARGAVDAVAKAAGEGVEKVVVDRGELTIYLDRSALTAAAQVLRDELRCELLSSLSGVDYLGVDERRLHVVYHLTSMTYRERVRLEVAVTVDDPHVPSVVDIWPTADWHERETYDFFGIVFDGHPALTRIQMPDDWEGHPQRKDYPLGGVPVEYHGAQIAPPEDRRAWA